MADTNFVVERKNSDVEAENSGTEELKSNSDCGWQESEWIRKIRSGLEMARSGQNAGGDVPIKKLPASLRKSVELYTPRHWQFGLHNRDLKASSSESEVLKIRYTAACNLNQEWDKFCADFVDNPADIKLKSYGIYSSITELSAKEVQYLLTLDVLILVLVLSAGSEGFDWGDQRFQLPALFFRALADGGFNVGALLTEKAMYGRIVDDLFLCENQIPMTLMKKAISKCYELLPEERKSNFPTLRELDKPDSDVTKMVLDSSLKISVMFMCYKFFAEPCPDKTKNFVDIIDFNYEVGELENCAHIFACFHKVMTGYVRMPPIPVTTTYERAKQSFLRALASGWRQLASIIATIFGFRRETGTGKRFAVESVQSATNLKKAGLRIQGIPGMVQQVAFQNGCLFLPIMSQRKLTESYISNMASYEYSSTEPPYPFLNYLLLMSHLIKSPEDVAYLINCGVIRAYIGTQKHIFQMWERLYVSYPAYSDDYRKNIVRPINKHCASELNKMITDFHNTYCSKPWLVISVISAIILLVATLIQTYVLVISSDKMQPHFPRGG